ncbi:hypothetical protein [Actinomadura roseirufa]|nr:hypothetical protein [Actinomadura roseirufa]
MTGAAAFLAADRVTRIERGSYRQRPLRIGQVTTAPTIKIVLK